MEGNLGMSGRLTARLIPAPKAPLSWRIKNACRWAFIFGWLGYHLAHLFTKIFGIPTLVGRLEARLIKADGRIIDYGVLSYRLVTSAGVAFIVDDWDNSATDITDFNYHASGTGTGAEATGDTALGTEATTITDRATGTKSQPSANILQSQATQSFTGSGAITEHGLFSVVTESSGVLYDRSVFAALNVANGDSIQWTYQGTINAGG